MWLAQTLTVVGVGTTLWLGGHNEYSLWPFDTDRLPQSDTSLKPPPPPPPILPLFVGSIVSLCFAFVLAWYFSRPIRILQSAFRALARGQLDVRIGSTLSCRKDELADLGGDFDQMAEKLGRLVESQQCLLHDVSHELRSPLARLQAATGLMEQQPERISEFIVHIHRDTYRMDILVGELLALARLNCKVSDRIFEKVEIKYVIEEVVDRTYLEFGTKKCQLDSYIDKSIVVEANHELLCRAIENVVRNSIRYSPDGGKITIFVKHSISEEQVIIEITDDGPGVHEENLEMIFAPFFRAEKNSVSSGFGLGLNITLRIVEAHGGTVMAINRPQGGLCIVMRLPCAVINN